MNILVVDDQSEGRYMLESLLKSSGHKVVCAQNGVEALEVLRKNTVNIIISDILMPKMDGFAFCRECKRDDNLSKIPFIFYTATYTDKKDEEFALSLGAEKFMVKPAQPDKFLEILADVIKKCEEGTLVNAKKPAEEEVFLTQYNKRLVEKLEQKTLNLEKELAERKVIEQKLRNYQEKLKALGSELSLAEERERRRIAACIHDDLAQKLTMVKLRLQSLMASVSDKNIRAALNSESTLMSDILDDTHSLTFELSNPLLYEVGLEEAIRHWLKSDIQKKTGLKCEFVSEADEPQLDEDVKIVLFRAVRELSINVIKHAGAKTFKVNIAKQGGDIIVTVEDDGCGFNTDKLSLLSDKEGGFGLFNIRERLEYMGGRMEIKSEQGKGTKVVMTVPAKEAG
jgi:signal transduction histidine kinase